MADTPTQSEFQAAAFDVTAEHLPPPSRPETIREETPFSRFSEAQDMATVQTQAAGVSKELNFVREFAAQLSSEYKSEQPQPEISAELQKSGPEKDI